MNNTPVITIDGPSSSGKGTIGRLLAQKLGWHFLDSGAFYRALALKVLRADADIQNMDTLELLAQDIHLTSTVSVEGKLAIYLDNVDVTREIVTEACGNKASQIAVFPRVRAALLQKQRDFCKSPGLIADGRDMGTVVFPEAPLKIFLSASVEERANRRYFQLKAQGINVSLADIKTELTARDERDSQRVVAPLKVAEDAVLVDTTHLSIEKVLDQLFSLVQTKLGFIGASR